MLLLYALTLLLSASLLFTVQPLIGKLVVPLLGGFPSVWNTCMVFFQAVLLAGYAYAHFSTARLGVRRQAAAHLPLLLLPFLVLLPLGVSRSLAPAGEDNPVLGLLLLLSVSVGLPFFAVATTAPLLQKWFAGTDHPAARDPYFLYAASNVGSMAALLSYPVLIEPNLPLAEQGWIWTAGYALLVALTAGCAVLLWRSAPAAPPSPPAPREHAPARRLPAVKPEPVGFTARLGRFAEEFGVSSLLVGPAGRGTDELTAGRVLRWVALAFVPSSLMLGVTTYISTDIAAIPLLWVLPLAAYLLSFILVFSNLPAWVHKFLVLALPVLLLLLVFLMQSRLPMRLWAVIVVHLTVLFVVALVCHGELARTRPGPRHLTAFYLWLSLGGVLGGAFNALAAPVLFTSLAEYPLALALAALLLPRLTEDKRPAPSLFFLDVALPMLLALLAVDAFRDFALGRRLLGGLAVKIGEGIDHLAPALQMRPSTLALVLTYGLPIGLCYLFVERPLRFGLGVAALLLAGTLVKKLEPTVIYRDRSFFGVFTVKEGVEDAKSDEGLRSRCLYHGHILHGKQFLAAGHRRDRITYYHPSGPIGQLFAAFEGARPKRDLAVIGLGTGSMAAYPDKGQSITFYEIDPKVKAISFDPGPGSYFTYVQDARDRGVDVTIVLGDARLQMERRAQTDPGEKYDVIVVDAFSSDAIPVHLMTREALRAYRAKLKDDGIIAFHTSNRYLRLEPVVGNVAAAEGMAALVQSDNDLEGHAGKTVSSWVMVANREEDFGKLLEDVKQGPNDAKRWERLTEDPEVGVWTDDFSNLVRVFDWWALSL
jgi:hypothetical protein